MTMSSKYSRKTAISSIYILTYLSLKLLSMFVRSLIDNEVYFTLSLMAFSNLINWRNVIY
uniref:Uncharacterized protein n=1 Tax=Lepeophtheirus salmonis TaxID=72036 RepID=A0A0K2U1D5_LEPSM